MKRTRFLVQLAAVLFVVGCKSEDILIDDGPELAEVLRVGDKIFIIDQTGKRWEVTHAVNEYDFVAEEFQFGLGPKAIPPILNPQHIQIGEEGYPDDKATFVVMGMRIKYRARAYPILAMAVHEVVDEVFGDTHVAVAF